MGVRYGWYILLVISLVVTDQFIYSFPTVANLNSTSIINSPYLKSTFNLTSTLKDALNPNVRRKSLQNELYNMPQERTVIKRSSNNSFFTKNILKEIQALHSRRSKSNEQYTIDVLPSPPRPVIISNDGTILNPYLNLSVGISIVAQSLDLRKSNEKHARGKEVQGHFYSSTIDSSLLKNRRYFPNHVTIDVQFLPWGESLNGDQGQNDCLDPDIISRAARLALKRNPPPAGVTLVIHPPPKDFKCTEQHAVDYFLSQLTLSSTRILIGAVEPSLCRVASHLAEKYNKLLILWSCLEVPTSDKTRFSLDSSDKSLPTTESIDIKEDDKSPKKENGYGHVAMISPTASQVARSVRAALQHLGWKKVSIITINSRYWLGVAQILDTELRAWHHLVPAIQVLSKDYNNEQILNLIRKVIPHKVKAFLMVLPSASSIVGHVMRLAGTEGLIQHAALILVDPLLEPKAHYFPFSEKQSVINTKNDEKHSVIEDIDDGDSEYSILEESIPKVNIKNVSNVSRNRTKGITVLTERDLKLSKLRYLEKLKKQKAEITNDKIDPVSEKINKRSSKSKRDRFKSSIAGDSLEKSNIFTIDDYDIDFSDRKNVSQPDSLDIIPIMEDAMFKTPEHLASLPIEVARSVFLLVPKSIGPDLDLRAAYSNSNVSVDDNTDETKERIDADLQFENEYEALLSRLAYDSVSLASHVLKTNMGIIPAIRRRRRRRRKRSFRQDKNISNKRSLKKQDSPKFSSETKQKHSKYIKNIRNYEKYSLEGTGEEVFQPETQTKVHEQIFFEVKRLQEYGNKDAEIRLKNILKSRVQTHIRKSSNIRRGTTLGYWVSSNKVQIRLSVSTTFGAFTGDGFIHASGRRNFEFLLLDWKPSLEVLVPVLRIHDANISDVTVGNYTVKVEVLADVDWAFNKLIPSDPLCELRGAPCLLPSLLPSLSAGYLALLGIGVLIILVLGSMITVFIRNWLLHKEMSKGPYKILLNSADITLATRADSAPRKIGSPLIGEKPDILRGGNHLVAPTPKHPVNNRLQPALNRSTLREADEIRAKYNGDFVHMRYFYSPGNFEVKNKTMTYLKLMHDIRHENINSFLGLLCDNIRPGFVFDYCSRGSLEDIIKQKDIKLDWSFRLSFLTDLVRGLRYLHSSPLTCHGRLTSRNCVIDARWVLKVTDYGLDNVYDVQNIPQPMRSNRDLLWKAPELLRDDALAMKGSQSGDVFSFSIIMQEVIIRGEPYCMVQLTHLEIIARLKRPPPMIRPSVSKGAAHPDVINIMKQCWAELPDKRPDFNQIYDLFKKLNQGRRLNIVDTMFQMLEKYSSNLEDLIHERTEQLHVEKKKTEQLLNRMLPSSVADQLKLGKPVAPEEFDEVTIYFSDIVGFTTISAYSTPFEVVDLLNDLYTSFDATINHYNVYKVETIGDAYMVVGGVPCRIEDHASQIATMALDLLHLSGKFRIRHLPDISLMLRIGIHTGPCCAGVVGVTMPRYCLFGDTVNTASRMESTGSSWRIHISETTATKLNAVGGYKLEFRGNTQLKGKGMMPTFWLLGKNNFRKQLPTPPEVGHSHGLDEELLKRGRQHYTARRDSTCEVMSSAIKMYNMNRLKTESSPQLRKESSRPLSPFNSGLLPDKKPYRSMKDCPIIVKVENYDSESCGSIDNSTGLSQLPQSPEDSDIIDCDPLIDDNNVNNNLKTNERTSIRNYSSECDMDYDGYNYLNPIRDSTNTDTDTMLTPEEKCATLNDNYHSDLGNIPDNESLTVLCNTVDKVHTNKLHSLSLDQSESEIILSNTIEEYPDRQACVSGKDTVNIKESIDIRKTCPTSIKCDAILERSTNNMKQGNNGLVEIQKKNTIKIGKTNINSETEINSRNKSMRHNSKDILVQNEDETFGKRQAKIVSSKTKVSTSYKVKQTDTNIDEFEQHRILMSLDNNLMTASTTGNHVSEKHCESEFTNEGSNYISISVKPKRLQKSKMISKISKTNLKKKKIIDISQDLVSISIPTIEVKPANALVLSLNNEKEIVPSTNDVGLHSKSFNKCPPMGTKEIHKTDEGLVFNDITDETQTTHSSILVEEKRFKRKMKNKETGNDLAKPLTKLQNNVKLKSCQSSNPCSNSEALSKTDIKHTIPAEKDNFNKVGILRTNERKPFGRRSFHYDNIHHQMNQRSTSFQLHSLELPSPTESTML